MIYNIANADNLVSIQNLTPRLRTDISGLLIHLRHSCQQQQQQNKIAGLCQRKACSTVSYRCTNDCFAIPRTCFRVVLRHFAMSSADEPPPPSSKRDSAETSEPTSTTGGAAEAPPSKKNKKEEFLKFQGRRQPRVGEEFQATLLPEPHAPGEDNDDVEEEEAHPIGDNAPVVEAEKSSEEETAAKIEQESE